MSMLFYGARGDSKKQLKGFLGLEKVKRKNHLQQLALMMSRFQSLQDQNMTLNTANGLFLSNNFDVKEEYTTLCRRKLNAEVNVLDFMDKIKSVQTINDWASNKTNNIINEIIDVNALDSSIGMVLLNAVYFKGKWLKRFKSNPMGKKFFYTSDGIKIKTDFMFLEETLSTTFNKKLGTSYNEDLNASILALPYIHQDFKMLIFHDSRRSMESLEKTLFGQENPTKFSYYLNLLERKDFDLMFPKFSAGSDLTLVKHFQNLGLTKIFGEEANFKGIVDEGGINVGDVVHKTNIEFTEEGSEAAAATAVIFTKVFKQKRRITIDGPFIFILLDTKMNIPIFMGRIMNPGSGQQPAEAKFSHARYKAIVRV